MFDLCSWDFWFCTQVWAEMSRTLTRSPACTRTACTPSHTSLFLIAMHRPKIWATRCGKWLAEECSCVELSYACKRVLNAAMSLEMAWRWRTLLRLGWTKVGREGHTTNAVFASLHTCYDSRMMKCNIIQQENRITRELKLLQRLQKGNVCQTNPAWRTTAWVHPPTARELTW